MKKTVAFLAGVFLAVTVGAFASACAADSEERYDVWLQRYEEQEIQISEGVFSDYEWTSSDESAVTAENGKLIAHKTSKDPVTITGKGKKKTINITVKKVNDTAGKPKSCKAISRRTWASKKSFRRKLCTTASRRTLLRFRLRIR